MYGVDVARIRTDDLDKKVIAYAKQHTGVSVLDCGCGGGGLARHLVACGAFVTGVDIVNYSDAFARIRRECGYTRSQLHFVHTDMTEIGETRYDVAVLQRVLHYLPYERAFQFLVHLQGLLKHTLYISVSGLESDIGRRYAHADKPLLDRFCVLDPLGARTFGIYKPLCLYTPEEFIVLLVQSGYDIEECWVSAFGNIKVVCNVST